MYNFYKTILSPIITEKSTKISEKNQFVFKVKIDSNKKEIKKAIEKLFKVKVKNVKTIKIKGKNKVFKGTKGRRARLTQSEGNFLIRKYESFDGPYHVINILRMTGDFYIDYFRNSYTTYKDKELSGSGRCYKTPPTERAF